MGSLKKQLGGIDRDAALGDFARRFPSTSPHSEAEKPQPPVRAEETSGEPEAGPPVPAEERRSSTRPADGKRRAKKVARAADEDREHQLTISVPMRVARELRVMYAETSKPVRVIVLEALRAAGLSVKESDLVDRRAKR